MGHRLSKIYTRTGDKGTTGLGDGARVEKDDIRVNAFGGVDELNAAIGVALSAELPEDVRNSLNEIQHDLLDLGAELCIPGHVVIKPEQVTYLETMLDKMNEGLPPLKEFILPGGSQAASFLHLARTICRRVERDMTSLNREEAINPPAYQYINRLSDLLFVMARYVNKQQDVPDVLWNRKR